MMARIVRSTVFQHEIKQFAAFRFWLSTPAGAAAGVVGGQVSRMMM
jgi:hypothetical protein